MSPAWGLGIGTVKLPRRIAWCRPPASGPVKPAARNARINSRLVIGPKRGIRQPCVGGIYDWPEQCSD
jgi:hypothetical protein